MGTKTAIVGPSGAGKSTILALIERFYDPAEGVIRLGGVDVRELTRAQTRAALGYVEQDSPVLAGTIRENLLLGAPAATDADCEAVLASVNLDGVLRRDPAGLDAQVGEDGIMLSGGERQRLAIARALLASPQVLLLDEPTASLDGRNEQALRQAIDAISRDRTLILVAHRLATVVDADQILVLEDGRLQAVGTHDTPAADQPAVPGTGRAPAAGLTPRAGSRRLRAWSAAASGPDRGRRRPAGDPPGEQAPAQERALQRPVAVHAAAAESGHLARGVQPADRGRRPACSTRADRSVSRPAERLAGDHVQPHRDQRAGRRVEHLVRLDGAHPPVAEVPAGRPDRDDLRVLAQPGAHLAVPQRDDRLPPRRRRPAARRPARSSSPPARRRSVR